MRNYSYTKNHWAVINKYCKDLDKQIIALQNYIDFTNANNIVLNYLSDTNNTKFYSNENLVSLHICKQEEDEITGVYLESLYPGEIVYNNFGHTITLYDNHISNNILVSSVAQGMAIIKKYDKDDYQIIALDAEGDFYIVSNVLQDGGIVFALLPHATVSYGLNYLFSLTARNVRWMYRAPDSETGETIYRPTNWAGFSLNSWYWNNLTDNRINCITSRYDTLWVDNSVLSHEICLREGIENQEVFCENQFTTESQGIDKGSVSIYTITTDMNNNITDSLYIYVNLY